MMSGLENNFFLKTKYFIISNMLFSIAAQLGDLTFLILKD